MCECTHISHSNSRECCWHPRSHTWDVFQRRRDVGSSFFHLLFSLLLLPPDALFSILYFFIFIPQLQDVYIMFNKIFQKHTLTLKWTFRSKIACCSFTFFSFFWEVVWDKKGEKKLLLLFFGLGLTSNTWE